MSSPNVNRPPTLSTPLASVEKVRRAIAAFKAGKMRDRG